MPDIGGIIFINSKKVYLACEMDTQGALSQLSELSLDKDDIEIK